MPEEVEKLDMGVLDRLRVADAFANHESTIVRHRHRHFFRAKEKVMQGDEL